MKMESDLYFQSQEEITPIIDYIPINENLLYPESQSWRIKEHLDQSRERTQTFHPSFQSMQPLSSLRIQSKTQRLNTDSAVNDYDKKTTSIMQGHSAHTIPSNELSINTIRDNLRSYMTYRQEISENRNNRSYMYSNQNYASNIEGKRLRGRSRENQKSLHFMNERSKLLRNIDRSLEEQRITPEKDRHEFIQCKRERTKLLNQILDKLQSTMKQKKEIELVKSNCKETDVSVNDKSGDHKERQVDFTKKSKKWLQTKNALRSAALESTQKCLSNSKMVQDQQFMRNTISEWKSIEPQSLSQSPTLIPHPDLKNPLFSDSISSQSLFTGHKDLQNRRENEIFTFSNLQGLPFQKHIKNVSISVSESSSKQFIASNGQMDMPVPQCLLCKVIGKRCSFH